MPSSLEIENDALRTHMNSKNTELEAKRCSNEKRKDANYTLSANIMALKLEGDKIQDSLNHVEQKIGEGNEAIDDQKECIERLEKQLHHIKLKNEKLEAQLEKDKVTMKSKVEELKWKIDETNQMNLSLEAKLRKQYRVVERQVRDIMTLEMGLGQLQAIKAGIKCENEGISNDCVRLEKDNCKLRDVIKHLVSVKPN